MSNAIDGASAIAYTPADITDLAPARVRAEIAVAALKTEQDAARTQAEALLRLMEPYKGANLNARA